MYNRKDLENQIKIKLKKNINLPMVNYKPSYDDLYRKIPGPPILKNNFKQLRATLNKCGFYSQAGEDIVIDFVLDKLNIKTGYSMEFGARDGIKGSNTFYFCKKYGFKSLMVECSDDHIKTLYGNAKKYENMIPYKHFISCEEGYRVDDILDKNNFPLNFDLLSIDIDSNDYWVWNSVEKYRPKLVIIEFNPNFKESLTIEYDKNACWKKDCYYGATAPALYKLGLSKDYDLIYNFHYNLLFIDKNINNLFEPLDINNLNYYWRKEAPSKRKMIEI